MLLVLCTVGDEGNLMVQVRCLGRCLAVVRSCFEECPKFVTFSGIKRFCGGGVPCM